MFGTSSAVHAIPFGRKAASAGSSRSTTSAEPIVPRTGKGVLAVHEAYQCTAVVGDEKLRKCCAYQRAPDSEFCEAHS